MYLPSRLNATREPDLKSYASVARILTAGLRKVLLVGLPVFIPDGEPSKLIIGLVICFLTYVSQGRSGGNLVTTSR